VARVFGPARPVLDIGVRAGAVLVAALFVAGLCLSAERASAQTVGNLLHFPQRTTPPKPLPQPANQPMLVQATEIRYDYTNNTVSAVGNVQIYYNGATIEADEVTYDQKSKRLRAQGNVRLTEAQQQEAVLFYQQSIQQAFQEVSNSLIAYRKDQEFREQQELLTVSAKDAIRLANLQYNGGVTSYLEVLDSDTRYFNAEIALAQAQLSERLALVQLYNALGGGWQQ